MTPKQRVLLRFGLVLALLFALVAWNPRDVVPFGLRDNLLAELVGAAITLLFVERALDVAERRTRRERVAQLRATVRATLEADLHALWSLLVEPRERDDPIRRAAHGARVERFLRDLASPEVWASAPAGHASAVRGRIRDLGEDADRLLVLGEDVEDLPVRARFDALRVACRDLDEAWTTTPRGQLATIFRERIASEVRAVLDGLDADA